MHQLITAIENLNASFSYQFKSIILTLCVQCTLQSSLKAAMINADAESICSSVSIFPLCSSSMSTSVIENENLSGGGSVWCFLDFLPQ